MVLQDTADGKTEMEIFSRFNIANSPNVIHSTMIIPMVIAVEPNQLAIALRP